MSQYNKTKQPIGAILQQSWLLAKARRGHIWITLLAAMLLVLLFDHLTPWTKNSWQSVWAHSTLFSIAGVLCQYYLLRPQQTLNIKIRIVGHALLAAWFITCSSIVLTQLIPPHNSLLLATLPAITGIFLGITGCLLWPLIIDQELPIWRAIKPMFRLWRTRPAATSLLCCLPVALLWMSAITLWIGAATELMSMLALVLFLILSFFWIPWMLAIWVRTYQSLRDHS